LSLLNNLPFGDLDALQIAAFQSTDLDVTVGVNLADVVAGNLDVLAQWNGSKAQNDS
jgi:hypothetical protein